jgi:PAS domain-containing protein
MQGRVTPVVESVLKGTGTTYVNANRTKDGRTVICEWRNAPIRDEQGNIVGVIAIAHSVLADGTASYALGRLLQNAPIGIAFLSTDGRPLFVNHQFVQLLGYSQADLYRMRFVDVTHPDDVAEDEHLLRLCCEGNGTVTPCASVMSAPMGKSSRSF